MRLASIGSGGAPSRACFGFRGSARTFAARMLPSLLAVVASLAAEDADCSEAFCDETVEPTQHQMRSLTLNLLEKCLE